MLFSIIVPVYNVELYLKECVESILNQTYNEFEIIIVDDGSTDSSSLICEELKQKDSRIKVYHKQNGGLLSAWRFGLEHASGEFVGSIDSDDYIENDLLENIQLAIKEYNCDMYVYGYKRVNQADGSEYKHKLDVPGGYYNRNDICKKILPGLINKGSFEDRSNIYLSRINKFIRRNLLISNNRFYDLNINFGEDNLWTIPNVFTASSMYVFENYYPYNYRYNPCSITQSVNYDVWSKFKSLDSALLEVCDILGHSDCKNQIYRDAVFHAAVSINNIIMERTDRVQKIYKIRDVINDENVKKGIKLMNMKRCSSKEKLNIYLMKYKMCRVIYYLKRLQKRNCVKRKEND